MNSHCCHANSEQRMARMQRQLELAASIAEIERINAHEKAKEKKKKQELHGEIAPAALKKLEANSNDASKLTVKEMDAIAYTYFMNAVLKGKKPEKVRGLQTLIRTHSDVMPRALAAITDNAAGSDESDDLPLSRHAQQHALDAESSDDSDDDMPVRQLAAPLALQCADQNSDAEIESARSDDFDEDYD